MSESQLLNSCKMAIDMARKHGADQVEVFGQDSRSITSNAEKSDLQISKSQQETRIGIRAFIGTQVGFASTNDISKLEVAATDAVTLAKASPGDPNNILPEPTAGGPLEGVYDPAASAFGTEDAVQQTIRMLELAESIDKRINVGEAEFSAQILDRVLVNSAGAECSEQSSVYTYVILTTAVDGERVSNMDYKFGSSRSVAGIDVEPITRRSCANAVGSLGAEPGESFKGQVLLDPYAVFSLFMPLNFQLNARNVLRGMSRWKDKLGETVASTAFTLVDDGRVPGGLGTSSFDREGIPHKRLPLIEDGVLRSFMHNTYTAHAFGTPNTGHASGSAGSLPAIGPTNLTVAPGTASKEDLISEIDQGILVSRFSGNANPVSGDFSGVAKAAYLIKNGKIDRPVSGTLIAGNVFDALESLSGISRETEQIFIYTYPYVRFEDISVTAG